MSEAISESTGKRHGLQRVCRAWDRSRSSFYARRQRADERREGDVPTRQGPKPKVSDEALPAAIRADLERSRSRARATGRSTHGFGSSTASGSHASA